jgi:HK97 family phage major capsid protein
MSPTDWHHLELTKDNENRYLIASPTARTPPMIWGQPVVESDGMALGDFLVGAFRMAATLFDREQAGILLSTEDQDNFVRNLVTILCEERLALAVTRPAAFVHGEFPAGSST